MDIYNELVWSKGCRYMVAKPGDICYKCGDVHNQNAYDAEVGLFKKEDKNEKATD